MILFSSWKRLLSNCRPWSLVMRSGGPYLEIQCFTNSSAIVGAVISGIGKASGHLLYRSMTVKQYFAPWLVGSGPMRSILMCSKRSFGGTYAASGLLLWTIILVCWHFIQFLTNSSESFLMPCQKYLDDSRCAVFLRPG